MKRQSCSKTPSGAKARAGSDGGQETTNQALRPVVLDVDLSVDPAKELEMLHNFETIFKPAAAAFEGYIDVKMCKLRSAIQGEPPGGVNYRFQLTYRSEELRRKWAASEIHQKVWPTIENALSSRRFIVLLFDAM